MNISKSLRSAVLGMLASCGVSPKSSTTLSTPEEPTIVAAVDLGPGKTSVMAYSYLESLVLSEGYTGWEVKPYGSDRLLFAIEPESLNLQSQEERTSLAERLVADEKIKGVFVNDGTLELEAFEGAPTDMEGGKYADLTTEDPLWVLKFTDTFEAWKKIRDEKGLGPGQGVLIGQVDTGLLQHPEIWTEGGPIDNILWDRSRNTREVYLPDATDLFVKENLFSRWFPPVPSHGTATASVMISPPDEGTLGVTGIAPAAQMLPVRTSISAVYLDFLGGPVADGVAYLINQKAHVIVLAMGGPNNPILHTDIARAKRKGAIIIAAGGNHARNVPRPGIYPETIAVGAGTIGCEPWEHSTSGPAIEALAPGKDVWHATTYQKQSGEFVYAVRRGVGTSFSTPLAAAMASLWLSYHGWQNLVDKYGAENIHSVFRWVLQNGGLRTCPGIAGGHGGGYMNSLKLLETPLPLLTQLDQI